MEIAKRVETFDLFHKFCGARDNSSIRHESDIYRYLAFSSIFDNGSDIMM